MRCRERPNYTSAQTLRTLSARSLRPLWRPRGGATTPAGGFFLSWKNAPRDEDSPGQRVLYSQSADGRAWTRTDGTNILFPNMSTNVRAGSDSVFPTRGS